MQTSPPPLPLPLPAHCLLPLQHKRRNDPQRHLLIKLFVKRLKHMPHANAYALQTRTAPLPLHLSIPHHVNDKWLSVCQLPLALQLLPRQLPLNDRTNGCKGIWRTKSFRRKTKIELRKKSSDGATRGWGGRRWASRASQTVLLVFLHLAKRCKWGGGEEEWKGLL